MGKPRVDRTPEEKWRRQHIIREMVEELISCVEPFATSGTSVLCLRISSCKA